MGAILGDCSQAGAAAVRRAEEESIEAMEVRARAGARAGVRVGVRVGVGVGVGVRVSIEAMKVPPQS